MEKCAGEIGHCHALLHRVAGIFPDRGIDPARLAIQTPPDFPVDHRVGDGAKFLLARAQFAGHLAGQPQGSCAPSPQQPGQQRKGQAQTRSCSSDQSRGIATDAGLEVAQGGRRHHPVAAGQYQVFISRQDARLTPGAGLGGTEEQRSVRGFHAVVNREAETRLQLAVEAGHEFVHANGHEHPADQVGAAQGDAVVTLAAGIDRHVHDDTGSRTARAIHRHSNLAGNRGLAGIARSFHRAPSHRVRPDVEPKCDAVEVDIRLDLGDRRMAFAQTLGPDRVAGEAESTHAGDMGLLVHVRNKLGIADGLDARKVRADLQ